MFDLTTGKSVVIGKKMAEKMNLKIGKKLVWTTTDAEGEIVSELARVAAIFHTGVVEVDSAFVILPIDRVRKTLGYDKDDATLISIMVYDQRYTGKMAESIEAVAGDETREVVTWKTTQADMAGLITIDRASNYMFQFFNRSDDRGGDIKHHPDVCSGAASRVWHNAGRRYGALSAFCNGACRVCFFLGLSG